MLVGGGGERGTPSSHGGEGGYPPPSRPGRGTPPPPQLWTDTQTRVKTLPSLVLRTRAVNISRSKLVGAIIDIETRDRI